MREGGREEGREGRKQGREERSEGGRGGSEGGEGERERKGVKEEVSGGGRDDLACLHLEEGYAEELV